MAFHGCSSDRDVTRHEPPRKPIYFSYAACGADDEYTAGNEEACVNQAP
jgi:hypothetical protein